jgi:hypothetical protein
MDSRSTISVLSRLWALIYAATYRDLSPEELNEVRNSADLLQARVSSGELADQRVHPICDEIEKSEILNGKRDVGRLDLLLHEIDDFREALT